jgi:probable HAF family extracellular repeat protein
LRAYSVFERDWQMKTTTYTYTTIDPPGSAYTLPESINDLGQIVGSYEDSSGVNHGFLDSGGKYTTIDPPGSFETIANGINAEGQIIGNYFDSSGTHQLGFLDSGGQYTTIDPPGSNGTRPTSINSNGQVVGYYRDANGAYDGFLYSHGTYTAIDIPGANDTYALSINDKGQIVGDYQDSSGYHGFLYGGGKYTILNVPGAADTAALSINDKGQIVGTFLASNTGSFDQGFLCRQHKCLGTNCRVRKRLRLPRQPRDRAIAAHGDRQHANGQPRAAGSVLDGKFQSCERRPRRHVYHRPADDRIHSGAQPSRSRLKRGGFDRRPPVARSTSVG